MRSTRLRQKGTSAARGRRWAAAVACLAAVTAAGVTPQTAQAAPRPDTAITAAQHPGIDAAGLAKSLEAVHDAGMYGIYATVRDGKTTWRGAAGVADRDTGRPVTPDMRQRIGSITKSMTSVALLQQVAAGRLTLDAPISRYLPGLIPGKRGDQVTVRMILSHTGGIGDYVAGAFPSLTKLSPASIDEDRFRHISPAQLVRYGLDAPATGAPGQRFVYSNTDYIIAGLLLGRLTGQDPVRYITHNVIERAGLHHTYFPRTPYISGPHPKMYESLYGLIDPPRDYSTYDMSWGWTAGAVISTTSDLDTFYRALLQGRLIPRAQLTQMMTPVAAEGNELMRYGLGLYSRELPCGTFWGHDGAVFGAGTLALSSGDGSRQVAVGYNLMKYEKLDASGHVLPSPIDQALVDFAVRALCGPAKTGKQQANKPSLVAPTVVNLPQWLVTSGPARADAVARLTAR